MMNTVKRPVGWIKGMNGVGVVYEVEKDGGYFLAVRYSEAGEPWHYLPKSELDYHISQGLGALTNSRESYLTENTVADNSSGAITIENPNWPRLYTGPEPEATTDADVLKVPFAVTLEGNMTVTLGGISKIFKLFN